MNENDIKKMMDDVYDDSKEDTLRGMIGTFYSKKLRSTVLVVWGYALVFVVGIVYSVVRFFDSAEPKDQLMWATLFVTFWLGIALIKIFAWEMIHRQGIKREIKRLELRLAELTQAVKEKA